MKLFVSEVTHGTNRAYFSKSAQLNVEFSQNERCCHVVLYYLDLGPLSSTSGSTATEPALDPLSLYHNTKQIHKVSLLFKIKTIVTLSNVR